MDPIHPIVPVTRGVGQVTPPSSTRRVDPDPRRDRGRDARRQPPDGHRPGASADEPDTPDVPHIDITA